MASLNKKYFIYYCRVSVTEGLNTELNTDQLILKKYDKEIYLSCRFRHRVIEIKKAYTGEKDTCNKYLSLMKNEDKDNPQIFIIWTENQKFRVFSNFHQSFLNRIFRHENIKNNSGKISYEVIDHHLNASDSFKESLRVALHLRCPIKSLCAD